MDSDDPLADSAVLIIDVINDFTFPEAEQLLAQMPPVVEAIDALRRRAESLGRPVVHVNDNFGRWRSNFGEVIEHCKRQGAPGAGARALKASRPAAAPDVARVGADFSRAADAPHHQTWLASRVASPGNAANPITSWNAVSNGPRRSPDRNRVTWKVSGSLPVACETDQRHHATPARRRRG